MNFELIVGDTGQDGTYLKKRLQSDGVNVLGISRTLGLTLNDEVIDSNLKVQDFDKVLSIVEQYQPTRIYYLAAFSKSSEYKPDSIVKEYELCESVHVVGLANILSSVARVNKAIKVFNASSCLVYSSSRNQPAIESDQFLPRCIYSATKLTGMIISKKFRDECGVFVSNGILYNHESVLRGGDFLTSKVIRGAIRIAKGDTHHKLKLADLDSRIDWSHAVDFIDAYVKILDLQKSDDFIISRGSAISIREMLEIVFSIFDLDYRDHVEIFGDVHRGKQVYRCGNSNKLRKQTGWKNGESNYEDFFKHLVSEHLALYDNGFFR